MNLHQLLAAQEMNAEHMCWGHKCLMDVPGALAPVHDDGPFKGLAPVHSPHTGDAIGQAISRGRALGKPLFDDDGNPQWKKDFGPVPQLSDFYHGTASSMKAAIMKEGFIPGKGRGADEALRQDDDEPIEKNTKSVYLTTDLQIAKDYAGLTAKMNPGSTPVIAVIHFPKAIPDPDHRGADPAGLEYNGRIPPTWIKKWLVGKAAAGGTIADFVMAAVARKAYAVFICLKDTSK